jgi:hypothetical protein
MNNKLLYRKHRFGVFPYGWEINVIFTNNVDAYRSLVLKRTGLSLLASCINYTDQGKSILVFDEEANVGTVAHEAYHAVLGMFKSCGLRITDQENVAYNLEFIVNRISVLASSKKKPIEWKPKK